MLSIRVRPFRDVRLVLFLAAFRFEEKYLFPHCALSAVFLQLA
jgi:hypothetical protein